MSTVLDYPQHHRIGAREYLRMGEAGVFAPTARLELIEGEIIEMAPIGSADASVVNTITRLLIHRVGDRAIVSVQNPIVLGPRSVPQPDVAMLKLRDDNYSRAHPTASDILLIVEVADTTLRFDTGTRVPLYARHSIPEVWVVDLQQNALLVYRDALPGGYSTTFAAQEHEQINAVAMPELTISARELLGDQLSGNGT